MGTAGIKRDVEDDNWLTTPSVFHLMKVVTIFTLQNFVSTVYRAFSGLFPLITLHSSLAKNQLSFKGLMNSPLSSLYARSFHFLSTTLEFYNSKRC